MKLSKKLRHQIKLSNLPRKYIIRCAKANCIPLFVKRLDNMVIVNMEKELERYKTKKLKPHQLRKKIKAGIKNLGINEIYEDYIPRECYSDYDYYSEY